MTDQITRLLDDIDRRSHQVLGDEPHPSFDGPLHGRWIDHQRQCAEESQQDAIKLTAALRAVLELHEPRGHRPLDGTFIGGQVCDNCRRPYPCPTVQAIHDALGGGDDR